MKKQLIFLSIFIVLMMSITHLKAQDNYVPVQARNLPDKVHIEIRPEMELLAGVLSQTSWMNRHGPNGIGNKYFQELKEFFKPYKNNEAVIIAESLTWKGFNYDAPPNFIVSLGPLPEMRLNDGYSDYLLLRGGGYERLEQFRISLIKLASDMNFKSFYQQHYSELEAILNSAIKGYNTTKVIKWLQQFYGTEGHEYYVIFAPAFFPGGGYGVTLPDKSGKNIIYQIIREYGKSTGKPNFSDAQSLEILSLHEWGHSFVNPAIDAHKEFFADLMPLFYPVENDMRKIAYTTLDTFLDEQVLRCTVMIAVKELYGTYTYETLREREKKLKFYLTDFTLIQLEYYQSHREQYPTFNDFVPYLLEMYRTHREELVEGI